MFTRQQAPKEAEMDDPNRHDDEVESEGDEFEDMDEEEFETFLSDAISDYAEETTCLGRASGRSARLPCSPATRAWSFASATRSSRSPS